MDYKAEIAEMIEEIEKKGRTDILKYLHKIISRIVKEGC